MTITQENNVGTSSLEMAESSQDLIAEKKLNRRKRIIMAVIGGSVLIGIAVIVLVVLLINKSEASAFYSKPQPIQLEQLLRGHYVPRNFNGTWISGNEILYRSEMGDILLYNTSDLSSRILLSAETPILERAGDVTISADRKYLLVPHDLQKLFRHSFIARYTIINIETKSMTELQAETVPFLQLAVWSPVGNGIVFVSKNNIFYRSSVTSNDVRKITDDGNIGEVYNGVPDWVFEEEVLGTNKALWISPDGKKLAFAKFNDKEVRVMTIPVYGEPGHPIFQYTKAVQIRYPKCGSPNPVVTLHVVDLEDTSSSILNLDTPPKMGREPVLAATTWAMPDIVTAIWMNRVQNQATIVSYSLEEPLSAFINLEVKQPAGWLDLFTPPVFSKDGSKLLLILSHDQKYKAGGYRHLTLVDRQTNASAIPLTSGTFVVINILGWDEANDQIYYTATMPNNSAVQHIFSVSTAQKRVICHSCELRNSITDGDCSYNSAEFSKDALQYVLNCDGPGIPESTIFTREGRLVIWENNAALHRTFQHLLLPTSEKHKFSVGNDGLYADVLLLLPPNMDRSGDTQYPMLVHVYAGPDTNQVMDKFNMDWGTYLASNKNFIYAVIDGRGSGLRGDKHLFLLNRRFGSVEVADQINVTRQLQQTLPYIDSSKTAMWGWSYGGYASSMALGIDTEDTFKCGIAVAPVTDWALYDSIYTERFMGLPNPDDNLKGYIEAQLYNKHEGLRNKEYFLIHGTLDDNVHFQQSLLWAKVLEQRDILFREMSYTDEDHNLLSVRPHLYHSMEKFLDDCLKFD